METQPDAIATPEPPAETFQFNLRFRGEDYTRFLTLEQVKNQLQILRSYQESEREFWRAQKAMEVHFGIFQTDEFQEFLQEMKGKCPDPRPPDPALSHKEQEKALARTFRDTPNVSTAARLLLHRFAGEDEK